MKNLYKQLKRKYHAMLAVRSMLNVAKMFSQLYKNIDGMSDRQIAAAFDEIFDAIRAVKNRIKKFDCGDAPYHLEKFEIGVINWANKAMGSSQTQYAV